mmetsp:Transcript_6981/g.11734  ORF Transcript_6981/g.11734 Transcript_6981/m.11734 type:complete len:211 (-) Transcript_6981:107-739(-)
MPAPPAVVVLSPVVLVVVIVANCCCCCCCWCCSCLTSGRRAIGRDPSDCRFSAFSTGPSATAETEIGTAAALALQALALVPVLELHVVEVPVVEVVVVVVVVEVGTLSGRPAWLSAAAFVVIAAARGISRSPTQDQQLPKPKPKPALSSSLRIGEGEGAAAAAAGCVGETFGSDGTDACSDCGLGTGAIKSTLRFLTLSLGQHEDSEFFS